MLNYSISRTASGQTRQDMSVKFGNDDPLASPGPGGGRMESWTLSPPSRPIAPLQTLPCDIGTAARQAKAAKPTQPPVTASSQAGRSARLGSIWIRKFGLENPRVATAATAKGSFGSLQPHSSGEVECDS